MFDTQIRKIIDPALDRIGLKINDMGLSANSVTWTGFGIGCLAALAIMFQAYGLGLVLILLSRLCDGLDGAVARNSSHGKSDIGGYLDIVLDFAFYGLIPFAFIVADFEANAVAGSLLLLVFYINGASFLTYALMAEKRGLDETERGSKSLLYTVGLAEATETIIAFVLFCLIPDWFSVIAYYFCILVIVTTATRFLLAYRNFR